MHLQDTPSPWLMRWAHLLRPHSKVLDVACGGGRHMRALSQLGHTCTGVDRDPQALARAGAWGSTLVADLENAPWPLLGQRFDAIVVTHYLWRPLWPDLIDTLADGGVLIYETFAQGNETVGKPSKPDFLLAPGELLQLAAQGELQVVAFEDGFLSEPDRFMQRLVAAAPGRGEPPVRWPLTQPAP